mgnify:FL=1
MANSQNVRYAARLISRGGVVAYPTEGVFGLGCLPDDGKAVARILDIKNRDVSMGLVMIVSDPSQLAGWTDLEPNELRLDSTDDRPVTWIVPAADQVPAWIKGKHDSIAVRQTTHPIARSLCALVDSPLVSTSANLSGRAPARNAFILRREFGALVDYIVPGDCGSAAGPSEIRDMKTGKILRPA